MSLSAHNDLGGMMTSIFPVFCVFHSAVLEKGVTSNPPVANPGGVSIYYTV